MRGESFIYFHYLNQDSKLQYQTVLIDFILRSDIMQSSWKEIK
jgi:hypothetical protein